MHIWFDLRLYLIICSHLGYLRFIQLFEFVTPELENTRNTFVDKRQNILQEVNNQNSLKTIDVRDIKPSNGKKKIASALQ